MKALNEEIRPEEARNLFKLFAQEKTIVSLHEVMKYLEGYGIKLGGLKGKDVQVEEKVKAIDALMEKLSQGIEAKEIDLFELYKKFDQNKQNKLFKEEFEKLIHSICSDISN